MEDESRCQMSMVQGLLLESPGREDLQGEMISGEQYLLLETSLSFLFNF